MSFKHTSVANVIWLNIHALNLATLNNDCISLASVCTQQWCSIEFEVPSTSEASILITEETNTTLLFGVKRFAPCICAVDIFDQLSLTICEGCVVRVEGS